MPPESGKDATPPAAAETAAPPATPQAGPQTSAGDAAAASDRPTAGAARRLALLDRSIPLLAALIGLIALAGAVLVEMRTDDRTRQIAAEMADLRTGIAQLQRQQADLAKAQDNGTVEGLLALQDRIARLEDAARQAAAQPSVPSSTDLAPLTTPPTRPPEAATGEATASPAPSGTGTGASTSAGAGGGDCIPVGLRFMATPNQTYPLCETKLAVKVGTIGDGTVDITGTGTVAANSFGTIPGSECTVTVYSADPAGFAELRVSCG